MSDKFNLEKSIEKLSAIIARERDLENLGDTDPKVKLIAIALVAEWVREAFGVEVPQEDIKSGLEDIFVYKSDTSTSK